MLSMDISLSGGNRTVGAAYLNQDKRTMQIVEFEDNDYFSYLESIIIQMKSDERDEKGFQVLINMPNDDSYRSRITDIFEQCDVSFTIANRADFNCKDVANFLDSLLVNKFSYYEDECSKTLALGALGCLINFSSIHAESTNHGKYELSTYSMDDYLRLDVAAMNALNIFPQNAGVANQSNNQDSTSIFELINHTKTSIGGRLIKRWIKQPIRDSKEINRRLDIVEFFVKQTDHRFSLQSEHLRQFPDIEKLHTKFYKVKNNLPHRANLVDCVKTYNVITSMQGLVDYLNSIALSKDHPVEVNYTTIINGILTDFENLKSMIEESIDISEVARGEYIINPDYSEVLSDLYQQIKAKHKDMENYRDELSKEFDLIKPLTLIESNSHGFALEVNKKEGDPAFRRSKDHFDVLSTKKGNISFTSKTLKRLVDEFKELQNEYKIEQDTLVTKVLDIVATYFPVIERSSIVIAELDALVSFATASTSSGRAYCRPTINDSLNKIELVGSRHPLIEKITPEGCISNDCIMIRDSSNLQIITGPNMGGKSTYIRQIAINVLLAHCGCFVPCDRAEVPILDAIIARVGAADHQLKGVSTFMAEMLEAACLLKSATKDSLIIMDELGRGTSTSEGFGLAWAIAEYLAQDINCYTFFATHFHELTVIDKEVSNAKNLHVTVHAEDDKLTMLYKVKEGVIDRSYGIHVAEMLKFPTAIVEEAKFISTQLEDFSNAGYKVADMI